MHDPSSLQDIEDSEVLLESPKSNEKDSYKFN